MTNWEGPAPSLQRPCAPPTTHRAVRRLHPPDMHPERQDEEGTAPNLAAEQEAFTVPSTEL